MRIVVHGQQAFGKAVLEALLGRGEDVVAVYAAPEGARRGPARRGRADGRAPAGASGIVPGPGGGGGVPRPRPDLQVMAFVTLIVPAEFLAASRRTAPSSTIRRCCPGTAAAARSTGRSSRARPRPASPSSGRTAASTPATCCCSGRTPISATDTLGSVYFDRLFPMGVEALLEAVDLVRAGTAPRVPQDEALATYEAPCETRATRGSTGASRAGSSTTWCAAATRRRGPGRPAAARCCRSSRRSRCPRATSPASAARWVRSSRSAPTASPWSAPTAACG